MNDPIQQPDLGPLNPLLADDNVTEILVNSWDKVFVDRRGEMLVEIPGVFENEDALRAIVDTLRDIATGLGRPPDAEGQGQVTIRDLVIYALRMRPDRLLLGEVRSSEVLDVLQAINTGHDGTMFSVHAGSARDIFARLETCGVPLLDDLFTPR